MQPFRGNPSYDEVTDIPYNTSCLARITENVTEITVKSIIKCRMETMYNSSCITDRIGSLTVQNLSKVSKGDMSSCVMVSRLENPDSSHLCSVGWLVGWFVLFA